MSAHEFIVTPRLILSRPRMADAPAIYERYASDPDVVKYVGFPRHTSVADSEAFICYSDAEWTRAPAGPYLVWARDDGRLLGSTGVGFEGPDRIVTGYVLAKDAWGHGYATEALRAMIELAPRIDVPRLTATCHPDHRASSHVLEKCGFSIDAASPASTRFPNLTSDAPINALVYSRAIA